MNTETTRPPVSPRWGRTTKFLLSLILVVLLGTLLVRFQALLAPLAFAFILAYLFNPLVVWLMARTRWGWGLTVSLVYLVLVIVLLGLMVAAGIAIEQQAVGLYRAVVEVLPNLPARLESLTQYPIQIGTLVLDLSRPLVFGPFSLDFSAADLQPLYDQLLATIRPVLSQTGTFLGSLASSTAALLGWLIFVLAVAYYLQHDLQKIVPSIERFVPAGYAYDVRRLADELGPIWNAFLRGQIILALVMGLVVGVTMFVLGVRYAPVLGLLAGLLEFVPIIGPLIAGTVAVLVDLFQPSTWLGLTPVYFALVIVGPSILLQQLENNLLVPRILGGSLDLHPVVILVGAVIGASLAGIVGLLLSAPTIATLRLFGRYVYRKMFDLDPWARSAPPAPPALPPPRALPRPKRRKK